MAFRVHFSGNAKAANRPEVDPYEFDESDQQPSLPTRSRKRAGRPSVAPSAKVPRISGDQGLANAGHTRYSEPLTLPSVHLASLPTSTQLSNSQRSLRPTACAPPPSLPCPSIPNLSTPSVPVHGTTGRPNSGLQEKAGLAIPTPRCPKSRSSNRTALWATTCPLSAVPESMLIRQLPSVSTMRSAIKN